MAFRATRQSNGLAASKAVGHTRVIAIAKGVSVQRIAGVNVNVAKVGVAQCVRRRTRGCLRVRLGPVGAPRDAYRKQRQEYNQTETPHIDCSFRFAFELLQHDAPPLVLSWYSMPRSWNGPASGKVFDLPA